MTDRKKINVIGAGLAGCEAAWQIAERGFMVDLFEMRPKKMTPAHHTSGFAELVCSNSLRGSSITNAVGLLKEEMRRCNSIIMHAADATAIPAGGALAVDRVNFSQFVTDKLKKHSNINFIEKEIQSLDPDEITVVATGPLTSDTFSSFIQEKTNSNSLYFYDAAAPIIEKSTINMDKVYLKSRYDKGEAAYLNCPMSEEEFYVFYNELITAEVSELKAFEKEKFFEGCMPIEVMAKRGIKTMLFGPMKPVGLEDPSTGKRPFAVVQLRQDNVAATLYNIVGFQTHLKWGEQDRVIRMIPGLESAEIVRYGVMHRNTFMDSPNLLHPTYQSKFAENIFFAGQMTGVEGYVESAASGLVAGINSVYHLLNKELLVFPEATALGALPNYITKSYSKNFQPMNINFGLFPQLTKRIKDKKEKYELIANQALQSLEEYKATNNI